MKRFLFVISIFTLLGCTQKSTIFVSGTLNQWNHVNILLYSTPMVSNVSGDVNGNPLDVEYDGWEIHLTSDLPISSGGTYNISISTDKGDGQVTVIVPSGFDITSPVHDTTLPPNTDVVLSWTSSVNADWYRVYIHHTSNNIEDTIYILQDTNSLTLPGSMFPDTNDWITIYIYAENGPCQTPGEAGNLTGDIQGFINAENMETVHSWVR